jgi:ATP-dependent 26S proteasome regulatory subunit
VVSILQDEVDPMVSVMKVEKAPLKLYVDIGGLDAQIQQMKWCCVIVSAVVVQLHCSSSSSSLLRL